MAAMHENRQDRERWVASGMPEAMVTIMFRDGTLPPPSAARWYDSGLTTEEIAEYRRSGRAVPDPLGLPSDPTFHSTWEGLSSEDILAAIDRGFVSADHYRPWAATGADAREVEQLAGAARLDGFDEADAIRQLRAGRTPADIEYSLRSGIRPKKVARWVEQGFDADAARAWSSAGFSTRKAGAWRPVTDDPSVATRLKALGFDPDTALAARPHDGWSPWSIRRELVAQAGAHDWDIDRWVQSPIADDHLAGWVATELGPDLASAWAATGAAPADATAWAGAGFDPLDAVAWRAADIEPHVAARRRAAGLHPPAT